MYGVHPPRMRGTKSGQTDTALFGAGPPENNVPVKYLRYLPWGRPKQVVTGGSIRCNRPLQTRQKTPPTPTRRYSQRAARIRQA